MRLLIAISGKARHGKDTVGDILMKKYGGTILKFAGALYQLTDFIQDYIGEARHKDPKLLQDLGSYCRDQIDPDFWVQILRRKILRTSGNIFITDLRYENEAETLRKMGFIIIRVNRPNAPVDRDMTHPSETALDRYDFDFVVQNDRAIDDLEKEIVNVISSI